MSPIHHILVATDFSEASEDAVTMAVTLARQLDAELTLVHVWQITPLVALGSEYATAEVVGPIIEAAEAQLDDAVKELRPSVPRITGDLRAGVAWDQILEAARVKKADLVIVGTHGRTGVRRALLGSVAEKVVRLSPVPVLAVPHQAKEEPAIVKSA